MERDKIIDYFLAALLVFIGVLGLSIKTFGQTGGGTAGGNPSQRFVLTAPTTCAANVLYIVPGGSIYARSSNGTCTQTGGSTINPTTGTVPVKSGATAFSDSLISQSGSTVFINGNLTLNGASRLLDLGQSIILSGVTNKGLRIEESGTSGARVTLNQASLTVDREVTFPNAAGTFLLDTATQTITNKTVSGASNTITNLNASNLSTGTVTAARGGTGIDLSGCTGALLWTTGVPTCTGTSGTGNFARVTSPVFTTPDVGTATATSVVFTNAQLKTGGTNALSVRNIGDSDFAILQVSKLRTVDSSSNIQVGLSQSNAGQVELITGGRIDWATSATQANTTKDTGIARCAAGVVCATVGAGTTAAGAFQATGTSQPTCSATTRGAMWTVQSTTGVGDIFQVCMKGTADTYAWRNVFTAP